MKLTKADKFFDGFFAFWGALLVVAMVLVMVAFLGNVGNDYPWMRPWIVGVGLLIVACVVGCARMGGE